jgi:hypothetical protein
MEDLKSITSAETLAKVAWKHWIHEYYEVKCAVVKSLKLRLSSVPQVTCNASVAEAAAKTVVEIELKDVGHAVSYVPPLALTFSK